MFFFTFTANHSGHFCFSLQMFLFAWRKRVKEDFMLRLSVNTVISVCEIIWHSVLYIQRLMLSNSVIYELKMVSQLF